jgi:hypothetical protein
VHLQDILERLRIEINETKHLKTVYNDKWFKELKGIIDGWNEQEIFRTRTHPLFIVFGLQNDRNVIQSLDRYYGLIKNHIGTHRIKSLRDKLRRLKSPDFANYKGTVYETIVVGKFVEKGYLKEYEPLIPGTNYRAEAVVEIAGQDIIIEATFFNPTNEIPHNCVVQDPPNIVNKFYRKLEGKIAKLKDIKSSSLLFVALGDNILPGNINDGLEFIRLYQPFESISAVIFSFNYIDLDMMNDIYINPNARIRLSEQTVSILRNMFKLKKYKW